MSTPERRPHRSSAFNLNRRIRNRTYGGVGGRGRQRPLLPAVCRACLTVWRCKSSPNLMEVKDSEAQERRREVGSEGSAEQNRDLTYRNRIGGHAGRASWQRTAKPISIKRPWGKSGRCAGKAVKLNSGDLHRCPEFLTEGAVRLSDRYAEVSRGHNSKHEQSARSTEALARKGRNRQYHRQPFRSVLVFLAFCRPTKGDPCHPSYRNRLPSTYLPPTECRSRAEKARTQIFPFFRPRKIGGETP